MKAVKLAVLFGSLSLVFMGCPYESKVPVDSQLNAKSDESYKGKWKEKSDDSYTYKIAVDGNLYTITKKADKGDDAPTVYQGFFSDIDGTTFANVWEKSTDGSDPKYWIYKFEGKGSDIFKIKGVTSNITEEFDSSKELKDFIVKYQALSFFWDKSEEKTFIRE
jgi:hypothetical protein